MKKLLIITGLFLLGSTGQSFGQPQTLGVSNYLSGPCGANVQLTAHDGASYVACGSLVSNWFPLPPAGSGLVLFSSIEDSNDPACIPPGVTGMPTWLAGACATSTASSNWDDATITILGVPFNVSNPGSSCPGSAIMISSVPGCGTVTVEWRIPFPGSPDSKIDIY